MHVCSPVSCMGGIIFGTVNGKNGSSRENGHRPVECAPTERKREIVVINRTFILGKAGAGLRSQNGSPFIAIDGIQKKTAEGVGLVEFFIGKQTESHQCVAIIHNT